MPNLEQEELKNSFLDFHMKMYNYLPSDIGSETIKQLDKYADFWLNKIKERDAMLWQKLEEMKKLEHWIENCCPVVNEHAIEYNKAISDAQALLEVKEK